MELVVYTSFLSLALIAYGTRIIANKYNDQKISVSNHSFKSFQNKFFLVYFLALFGDWLQGPYVYKLYAYYGFQESDIAVLYIVGFASSVVFGTYTGPLADVFGRRKVSIAFSITYTLCCLTKLSSNFVWLFVGRILGGIATSMLFSTFESWYVYQHSHEQGYPGEWIGVTFSVVTFWNGVLAITAGVVSNVGAETFGFGPVAPFVVALFPLILCGLLVFRGWEENYGNRKNNFSSSCSEGLQIIYEDKKVFLLGCIQSVLESCMYIFVFLWTPVLDSNSTPIGMVFSCFMVCIMIGSNMFTMLTCKGHAEDQILKYCLLLIGASMSVCCFTTRPTKGPADGVISFFSFLALEVGFGMYFPTISSLRSKVVPESHRASVMNWFRVPMNCITCGALMCLSIEAVSKDKRIVFAFCLALSVIGIVLCSRFSKLLNSTDAKRKISTLGDNEDPERSPLEECTQ